MALSNDGVRQVRLRCPETKRWRTYEEDRRVLHDLLQELKQVP